MSKFVQDRDVRYFRNINRELVDDIIETPVVIYKIVVEHSPTNIYGEAPSKTYFRGVSVVCICTRQDKSAISDFKNIDTTQKATFAFMREVLYESRVFPEVGDIIEFDGSYYEVDNTNDNQLIAGQPRYN